MVVPQLLLPLLGLLLLALWGLLLAHAPSPDPHWPPGPRPLPFIGNLHQLRVAQQDRSLLELSRRYGPVFTVQLGQQKMVVLAGYHAVKQALVGSGWALADRPPIPIFQSIQGGRGIFFSSGPGWVAARQLTVRTLHRLGYGRTPGALKVLQELRCLQDQLDSYRGHPFPLSVLGWAPCNVTFTLLFGRRFDYGDPVFVSLLGLIEEVMVLLGSPCVQLFNLFPWLGTLLGLHRPVLRRVEEIRAILRDLLPTRPPSSPPCSYLDALTQEAQLHPSSSEGQLSEEDVVACALDLLMAGTETTASTLQWAALLMAQHLEVQGHVQEELDRVLGPGRPPRPEDEQSLPYTSAVLHEVQRAITLLPHMPRCTTAPTLLGGYLLPKGTPVIPLLSSVLLDRTQWATPDQFNPGHFLDAQGCFLKREAFLPFSAGRRACVGERLARTELFLLFSGLLQGFQLSPPPGLGPESLDTTPAPAFTMRPPAQALCALPRTQR
ncbi:cytochrome P450 2W1 isoform X1 [Erinaceus europaeus]|uniref:Cytochrome P450 2W1 isoform X1 n=1 Tax=Erinaceus europaeus TaxID=9365 RepID=A0A1S2ZVC9_ERIEU|nr:cytochrome P450 2W1 isoform X1 [Erinaceus europaeus]